MLRPLLESTSKYAIYKNKYAIYKNKYAIYDT
jgi:hypothetical protein